jgi:hypothetical protein
MLGVRQTLIIDPSEAIHDTDVSGFGQERAVVDKRPRRQKTIEAASVAAVAEQAGNPHHSTLHLDGVVRGKVIPASRLRGHEHDTQRMRITLRDLQANAIHVTTCQKQMEQTECGPAQECEEEEAAVDADGQRAVGSLVDGPVRQLAWHDLDLISDC